MVLRRVVLGSAVFVAFASSLEFLLDDAGEHIRPGTAWTKAEGDCAQAGHGGGFHHNNGVHNEDVFATWNFTIAKDGCYWVEEFHPDTSGCDFTLSTRVPVHIYFCRGLHTAGVLDQSQRAGQWNRLTRLPFYTNHSAAIHISALGFKFEASGVWAADAFRLVWHAETCHDEEVEPDEAVTPTADPPAEPASPTAEEEPKDEAVASTTEAPAAPEHAPCKLHHENCKNKEAEAPKEPAAPTKTYTEKSTLTLNFESLPEDVTAVSLVRNPTFVKNVVESIATGLDVDSSKLTITNIEVITARRMKEGDQDLRGAKIKVEYKLVTTSLTEASAVKEAFADPAKLAAFSESTSAALVEKEAASGRVVVVKEIIPAEANMPDEKEDTEPLKEEVQLPLLQALLDDADVNARGATLEPLSHCPATASRTFHHDGLQKGRHAKATFEFNPPHDGCYLIEEMHPHLEQCVASSNTKVHVNYCKGLQAAGTVDQTAQGGQWTFIAALPFYAGHRGNITLSNEGTEPGTLTVFDQIRFTWSGKSCSNVDSHPRHAEIRMAVDFKNVANRLPEFGSAFKAKLAALAKVPESSLRLTGLRFPVGRRLTGLRSASIISEFLVLPSVVDDPLTDGLSPRQTMELLRGAVATNAAELCTLTGGPLEGCNVELKDLGVATPSIRPVLEPMPEPVPEQPTQKQGQTDKQGRSNVNNVIIVVCAVAAVKLLFFALYMFRSRKTKNVASNSKIEVDQTVEIQVTASMEEGKSLEEKKPVEEDDNNSTLCPSNSDKQSEPSICGDVENTSTPEQGMTVIKALSDQSL